MRVLIIGGGIAGSAAALALHRAGFQPVVYEAHPDSGADIGAFLTLASNGMRALGQIEAAEAVAGAGFPLTCMRVIDDAGTELADAPLGAHDHPLTRFRCLRRADLGAVLQREVRRRGIALVHGARLSTLSEHPGGVTATFTDGQTADGDLLLGADGLRSTVRSLISPLTPRYAGQRVFYGYTTEAAPPTEPGRITMIRGSATAFGYACSPTEPNDPTEPTAPTRPTNEVFWFARLSAPPASDDEIAATPPAHWRDLLLPLLRPDTTPAADIVAATGDHLMVTNATDLPLSLPWRTPRTLLIGDAAHAASPATGQGASMALEDAVILAKALRDSPTTPTALATYERLRRPRVESNITASAALSAGGRPTPRPAALTDDELIQQLDWETPLPG